MSNDDSKIILPGKVPDDSKIILPGEVPQDAKPAAVETGIDFNSLTPDQAKIIQQYDGLGDEMEIFRSDIDGNPSVVAKQYGRQVCQYCFKRFGNEPDNLPEEIYPLNEDAVPYGEVRVKVHGQCHEKFAKELAEKLRPA